LFGDELGYRAGRLHSRPPGRARLLRHPNQAPTSKLRERILNPDPAEAGDAFAAPSHNHLDAFFDSFQIFAQSIVKLSDPNFALMRM